MILNTSLTLCMEIVFPGGGGSGRSPFESADPVERVGSYLEALKEGKLNIILLNRQGGGGLGSKRGSTAQITQNRWFIGVKSSILVKTRPRGRGLSPAKSCKR